MTYLECHIHSLLHWQIVEMGQDEKRLPQLFFLHIVEVSEPRDNERLLLAIQSPAEKENQVI